MTVAEAKDFDTHIVNTVENYYPIGLVDSIPSKVVNNFRVTRACNRVADEKAIKILKMLYNKAIGEEEFKIEPIKKDEFIDLLQSEDLEELVSIYLQVEKDYLLYSSSNKLDTQSYEFVMVHRSGKNKAIAQVKQGDKTEVDLGLFDQAVQSSQERKELLKIYICDPSSKGLQKNTLLNGSNYCKIYRLSEKVLLDFFVQNTHIMPERMLTMYEYVKQKTVDIK